MGVTGITGAAAAATAWTNRAPAAGRPGGADAGAAGAISPAYSLDLKTADGKNAPEIEWMKRTGRIECQTCKRRRYQDGSNDPGVSFKAPGYISPESSAATVRAHEQEHVVNEQARAQQEGRRVVSQSVRLFTSVCPECGKAYVSGGETRTVTASDAAAQAGRDAAGRLLDLTV